MAALFAPKPLAMTGADDWTREIMTRGLPELRRLYKLLGAETNVAAKAWVRFPHNFNKPAREFVATWLRTHLMRDPAPVHEAAFDPVPVEQLKVFDATHPRPAGEQTAAGVRAAMSAASDAQMAALGKDDAAFKAVVGPALRVMLGTRLPGPGGVTVAGFQSVPFAGVTRLTVTLTRPGPGEVGVPAVGLLPPGFDRKSAVLWLHPAGTASLVNGADLTADVKPFLAAGLAVLAVDLPAAVKPDPVYAGFTWGYNRCPLGEYVHAALTVVGHLRDTAAFAAPAGGAGRVCVVGWGECGVAAALTAAVAGDAVGKLAADLGGFTFDTVTRLDDPMLLPGAVKYGGLPAFLRLRAAASMRLWYPPAGVTGLAEVPTAAAVAGWLAGGAA